MVEFERFLNIASFDYDLERLDSKVNVSSSRAPNPAIQSYLDQLDQEQFARLGRVGFDVPERWLA